MIYGYARVSTAFETTKDRNQTFDRQLMILKEHGVKEENIFCDRISGKTSTREREAFDKLMNIVLPGDEIVVSEMSRFSRSLTDLIHSLDTLIKRQIGIYFIKENMRISGSGLDPMNRLMIQLLGAFNEFERNIIAQRVHEGMQASKLKGTKLGRPQVISDETKQKIINDYISGISYRTLEVKYQISLPTLTKICKPYSNQRQK